jgi:peptidoglycan/xylan/chitin deacetylase (PgdA/CDA1 family)
VSKANEEEKPEILRAVAYHGTPKDAKDPLARQLDYFARHFWSVDEQDLERFMKGGKTGKPIIVISFDDGLYSNYEVAAPLLEERGLVGWFFVSSLLAGLPAPAQATFCREHEIAFRDCEGRVGQAGRVAMSWTELADLSRRGHVVGCHTATHHRMRGEVDELTLRNEIFGAKEEMEKHLEKQIKSFAWVGGEPDTYSRLVFEALPRAGFEFAFTTQSAPFVQGEDPLLIHRTVLDADMGYAMFRLKMMGLSDLAHLSRRKRSIQAMKPDNAAPGGLR